MGTPKQPNPANLICAVTFAPEVELEEVEYALTELFGDMDAKSGIYDFHKFTDYYEDEMGKGLKKYFVSFRELIRREEIADIKLKTNELELEFAEKTPTGFRRKVNIDPGYVAEAQLVLPTVKGYSHRIYLQKGIFAEVTLIFEGKSFKPLPWTYPDYRTELAIEFFNKVRENYIKKLKSLRKGNAV
ncbi:MAG: DUF4416 family protein [Deferribacteres bacterium]|nr:DUF4416 family protein [Deferribacteres bacterium]